MLFYSFKLQIYEYKSDCADILRTKTTQRLNYMNELNTMNKYNTKNKWMQKKKMYINNNQSNTNGECKGQIK